MQTSAGPLAPSGVLVLQLLASAGETIENPMTGERITWLQTAADTAGESLVFDLNLSRGAFVSARHMRSHQSEHFTVLAGSLRITVDGPAGTEFTIRHAEVLENGELGVRPLRSAAATDGCPILASLENSLHEVS